MKKCIHQSLSQLFNEHIQFASHSAHVFSLLLTFLTRHFGCQHKYIYTYPFSYFSCHTHPLTLNSHLIKYTKFVFSFRIFSLEWYIRLPTQQKYRRQFTYTHITASVWRHVCQDNSVSAMMSCINHASCFYLLIFKKCGFFHLFFFFCVFVFVIVYEHS